MSLRIRARLGDAIVCAALLAFGLGIVWQASGLRIGSVALPGPGLMPLAFGAILCLGAAASLVRAAASGDDSAVELGNRPILFTAAALVGLAALFDPLGAKLSIALFVAAMLVILSEIAVWKALIAGTVAAAAVWGVFVWLLGVRLPTGLL